MAKPNHNEVTVRALCSAVSRGTERLVLTGRVPPSEYERMKGPFQAGDFPSPVKYGYCAVGVQEDGQNAGRRVFALHPHQTRFVVPETAVTPIPDRVPTRRATLAANIETAITVVWDSHASLGDHVLVVGAGVVGLLVARLMHRIAGTSVTVCDVDASKRTIAERLGATFATPAEVADGRYDVAVNASACGEGLTTALAALGPEGRVVEASWHGETCATLPLGGPFHARRLTIASSQVGTIPPARAPRWTHARRMDLALKLAEDDALDALLTHEIELADTPEALAHLILHEPSALAVTIRYPDAEG